MKHLLIVIGSGRKGRVADKVLPFVKQAADKGDDFTTTVVDLAQANLPFYDNETSPKDPSFVEMNDHVQAWAKRVSDADAVLMITPEYNHNLSALQKNAIDWLYIEWVNKPVAIVTYGWYAGQHALDAIKELAPVIEIDLKPNAAQLQFNKDIAPDGTILDEAAVTAKIEAAVADLH